ncbi:hypothetical protein JRO89_XS08G0054700 [Xanthoceras sorbifolium]|uniref:Uncharacterized protein n=1 Tax=Xanthoceras sorbifolium TaxID=99658 RepID=A0ABQ8HP09_9ROSI|nr:hypothetical protein JRO89_XS08G0054700 [Xanthoceras sorbifolium]
MVPLRLGSSVLLRRLGSKGCCCAACAAPNTSFEGRDQKRDTIDPISLNDIDDSNEWVIGRVDDEGEGEDENVFSEDGLTWIEVARATGDGEPSYLVTKLNQNQLLHQGCHKLDQLTLKMMRVKKMSLKWKKSSVKWKKKLKRREKKSNRGPKRMMML